MSNDNPFSANPSGQPSPQPSYQPPQKSNTTLIVLVVLGAISIPLLGCCAGLLLPAVQAAREAARRISCSNNIKQIGLAMHNYHAAYGSLPPAYTVDAQGQPLHSWRTLILPFVEEQALFDQIELSKPWDDPVNQMVAQTAVQVYGCPSMADDSTLTPYVAIVDPSGVMSGSAPSAFGSITDGLANTILVKETDRSRAVPWMSPQDTDLPTFLNVGGGQRTSSHIGGAHVLMADGAVIFITDSMDANMRQALVSKAGGEAISP